MKELLVYLIHHYEESVSRQKLLNLLFDGEDTKKTVNYLHVIVYSLRKTLKEFGFQQSQLRINKNYMLEAAPGICDYIDFVRFTGGNEIINPVNVAEGEQIWSLYRAPYLSGEDYPWALETTAWLEEEYEELSVNLARYYANYGDKEKAASILHQLLSHNPWSENGRQALLEIEGR